MEAITMKISAHYGSHLPALMWAMEVCNPELPVLELGMGVFSTPFLHYKCLETGQRLVSYDNEPRWNEWAELYRSDGHQINFLADWDEADICRPWAFALIDHSPDYRRIMEIRRLANWAKMLVVHDTNGKYEKVYHYSEIIPLFKYRRTYRNENRHTDILSNFVEL